MANSNQEQQDQRSSSSVEDSHSVAMTIEFLRARLLSERSVSRSARQRADELEKRVGELEEQLRIVSLQRKMAEKATVDVLSILENRGISEPSETYDSGSDQETHQESPVANNYTNGEGRSLVSKRRSDLEELSSSDLDSSPITGRSLSWKGRSDSSRSREKYRDPSMRRRNALSSSFGSSSPKHHLGKSCRQIRRREARLVVQEHETEPIKFDSQENGASTPPESVPDCLDSMPEVARESSQVDKALSEDPLPGSVANDRCISNHLDANGHGQDKDMKKALEHRAQLIDKYEEMEKAQREWEEKYRENNTSTLDSYDPGNTDEVKAQTPYNVGIDISETKEAKSNKVDVSKESSKPQANGFLSPSCVDVGDLKVQTSSSTDPIASRFQAQEFAFPTAMEKEAQESLENRDFRTTESLHNGPLLHRSLPNQSYDGSPLSEAGSSSHKNDFSGSQNDLYALVPHNPPVALGGVLDALKQAKLSLRQKIDSSPLEGTAITTTTTSINKFNEPHQPGTRVGDRVEIPVGCTGLFRLPTDFATEEASTRANFLGSESHLSLEPYYPGNGVAVTTPGRFVTTPYISSQSVFPPDDRFFTSNYLVSGSRASTLNSRFYSHSDTGLSSYNRYNNSSSQPSYPPFPDLMPRIPSDEVLRRPFPSSRSFGSPADRFSFHSDQGRPNMYR